MSIFLDAYPNTASWPYLDKLICQWRKVEEETRKACGLEPAPPYGRCSLFRGQDPSEEWLQEAGEISRDPTVAPTITPSSTPAPISAITILETSSPTAQPSTSNPTNAPTAASFNGEGGTGSIPTQSPSDTTQPASPTSGWGRFVDILRPGSTAPPTAAPSSTMPAAGATSAPTTAGTPSPVTSVPTLSNLTSTPADLDCDAYSVSYERMCSSSSPCCEATRSATDFCWDLYENVFPDDLIYTACNKCCQDGPKTVGPPATPRDDLPKTIQCSSIENPFRVCNSCCTDPRPATGYCSDVYSQYGDDVEQICVSIPVCYSLC